MKTLLITTVLLLGWPAYFAAQQHAPIDKNARQTSAQELQQELGKGTKVMVIDVRSPQDFSAGHIPGAVNMPLEELPKMLQAKHVPKSTTLVTVCDHGGRSSRAAVELEKLGYKTSSFCTLDSWKKNGNKIETGSSKPRAAAEVYKFTCHHHCKRTNKPHTLISIVTAPASNDSGSA